jgi:hypothetical protein
MPTISFKNFRHETSVRSTGRNPQNESPRRMLAGYQKYLKLSPANVFIGAQAEFHLNSR